MPLHDCGRAGLKRAKMKREVKIGLFAVAMIVAAWAGIRFLKGFDIFSRNAQYFAAYERIDGVQNASPVMMRGVKVGSVTGVEFDPGRSDKVVLHFTIRRSYRIPEDSEARIVSDGLLGGKAIELIYGSSPRLLQPGDTIRSGQDRNLMDMAGSELDFLKQKLSEITAELTRALDNFSTLVESNSENVAGTLAHVNTLTGDLSSLLAAERGHLREITGGLAEFSGMLGDNAGRVDSLIGSVNTLAGRLEEADFAGELTAAVSELHALLAQMREGDGTVGRLMTDPALYDSLTVASGNLAALLADLKAYPARYVHLSLFGRDPEKMKERAERRAARAAEKARRDSL